MSRFYLLEYCDFCSTIIQHKDAQTKAIKTKNTSLALGVFSQFFIPSTLFLKELGSHTTLFGSFGKANYNQNGKSLKLVDVWGQFACGFCNQMQCYTTNTISRFSLHCFQQIAISGWQLHGNQLKQTRRVISLRQNTLNKHKGKCLMNSFMIYVNNDL